jgi:hypothetical protein
MTEFPAFVYQATGKYQRPGGGYDFLHVKDETEFQNALADGWFETLEAAVEARKPKKFAETPVSKAAEPVSEPSVDDNAPPTREELEAKATELGIKFDGRYSDKRIALLIDEALAK